MTTSTDDWLDIDRRPSERRGRALAETWPERTTRGRARRVTLLAELLEAPPLPAQSFTKLSLAALEAARKRMLCASLLAYRNPTLSMTSYERCYVTHGGFVGAVSMLSSTGGVDGCLLGTVQGLSPTAGQQDVVLAFRGTLDPTGTAPTITKALDWANSAEAVAAPLKVNPELQVHKGFNDTLESLLANLAPARRCASCATSPSAMPSPACSGCQKSSERLSLVELIKSRLAEAKDSKLYITGHSKGGAVAHLAAYTLYKAHPEIPIAGVVSFEAPRCGGRAFVEAYKASRIPALRYEFQNDIVPHLPPNAALLQTVAKMGGVTLPKVVGDFNYVSAGELRFVDWSGAIRTNDSYALLMERMARFLRMPKNPLALLGALAKMHTVGCGSDHWKATFNTTACP
jgi:hypothetical protein